MVGRGTMPILVCSVTFLDGVYGTCVPSITSTQFFKTIETKVSKKNYDIASILYKIIIQVEELPKNRVGTCKYSCEHNLKFYHNLVVVCILPLMHMQHATRD